MKGKDVKIQARYEGKAGRMIKKKGGRRWKEESNEEERKRTREHEG
jgi:hypothetical protein